jgi:hypothetical protein
MSKQSKQYALILELWTSGAWRETRVRNAIGKWITQDEAEAILNTPIKTEDSHE